MWRNTLKNPCPGLRFNGFVYTIRGDQVCGNMQTIRVLQTQEICMLGPFTKVEKKPQSPS